MRSRDQMSWENGRLDNQAACASFPMIGSSIFKYWDKYLTGYLIGLDEFLTRISLIAEDWIVSILD